MIAKILVPVVSLSSFVLHDFGFSLIEVHATIAASLWNPFHWRL